MSQSAVAAGDVPARPESFRAPLFGTLLERMAEGGRWVVMDLGSSQPRVLERFAGYRCRMHIVDLPESLPRLAQTDSDGELLHHPAEVLPPDDGEPLDLVLCWDLINYCTPPMLQRLIAALRPRMHPRTLLHGLIVYTDTHMPDQPNSYGPEADDQLICIPASEQRIKAPRWTPKGLEKYMDGFRAEEAKLLNNGMQEYLFRVPAARGTPSRP